MARGSRARRVWRAMGLSTVALGLLSAGTWLLLEEKRPRVVFEESRPRETSPAIDVQAAPPAPQLEVATPAPEESAAPAPAPEKHSTAAAAQRSRESLAEPTAIRAVEAKTVPAEVRVRLQERLAQARERDARVSSSWGW